MNLKHTRLNILGKKRSLESGAVSGVSLHCHTEHSKEMLDFVPHYAAKLPIIAHFWHKEQAKYIAREGKDFNFDTGFWSPPLKAHEVYDIEKEQINNLGLDAIVSLTDHDSIDATVEVNEIAENAQAPISMEWTVPYGTGFFHVGVHNLPKQRSLELTETLLDFTFVKENHTDEKLAEMFALLNDIPEVLVVLNHPLWDIELAGKEKHDLLLKDFLRVHGRWLHALEVNGFRKWSENKAVIELAESIGMPVVTGGDRHGCQPNTVINLSKAASFEEFAAEIRIKRQSEIVLMPAYEQPIHSRQLQSFSEILRHYPAFEDGRKKWFDRVHFDIDDGHGLRPLSVHWLKGGPPWLRTAIWVLGVLGGPAARPVFRATRKKHDRLPKGLTRTNFAQANTEDTMRNLSEETAS